ncbi:MAG TPA: EcsC family protein [Terriglobales bacterium]|nr:EcsC family protein [Terriglobales bacterium]
MSEESKRSWLTRRAEEALKRGFTRAYDTVKVDPAKYLLQLQAAHGLPISSFNGVFSVEVGALDNVAGDIVRGAMKVAAVEGAGLGVAGLITIIPDLSILAAITLRTVQKLSLLYGFEYNTDDEIAELWVAAASAAGVDISRELLEKEVVNRFVPRVIQRIAAQASGEVVEKWAGRLIPLASSVLGAGLNYYFVRAWGQRAQSHFRGKHLAVRRQLSAAQASVTTDDPPLLSS